jgi:hypothetical protein
MSKSKKKIKKTKENWSKKTKNKSKKSTKNQATIFIKYMF